ncbi:MAG: AraC family transcriptional regulator [Steroidobacteraceae bacterium]
MTSSDYRQSKRTPHQESQREARGHPLSKGVKIPPSQGECVRRRSYVAHTDHQPGKTPMQQPIAVHADVTSDSIANMLAYALQAVRSSQDDRSPRIVGLLQSALEACNDRPSPTDTVVNRLLAPWQVRKSQQMMLDHLERNISSTDLAKACRLSRGHFCRAFKQTVGIPPHRWLVLRRIEKAKTLMNARHCSLAEIAFHCGFSDQAHFSRIFKAVTRSTPSSWRRSHSRNAQRSAAIGDTTRLHLTNQGN